MGSGFPRGKHLTNPAGPRGAERETLDKLGWSARRGTGEQAAQAMDTTRIMNNNGTLSLRRNCEQWLGE